MLLRLSKPPFDYRDMPAEKAAELRAITKRIEKLASTAIITIGRELLQAKRILEHGRFIPWLEANFEYAPRTAQRWMKLAEYAAKCDTVSHLEPSAVYALAAQSTPEVVRDRALSMLERGQTIKRRDIEKLKKEYRAEHYLAEVERREEANRRGGGKKVVVAPAMAKSTSLFKISKKMRAKLQSCKKPADKDTFWVRVERQGDRLRIVELAASLSK